MFDGEVSSVFLPGAAGEFEVLELHSPLVSLLKKGKIIIDWKKGISINRGAVKVSAYELVAVVERGNG